MIEATATHLPAGSPGRPTEARGVRGAYLRLWRAGSGTRAATLPPLGTDALPALLHHELARDLLRRLDLVVVLDQLRL